MRHASQRCPYVGNVEHFPTRPIGARPPYRWDWQYHLDTIGPMKRHRRMMVPLCCMAMQSRRPTPRCMLYCLIE